MDTRPLYVEIKTRLIKISLGEDGAPKETVLEAPTLIVENNRTARISISVVSSLRDSLSFSVTPQLSGDKRMVLTEMKPTVEIYPLCRWEVSAAETTPP